MGENKKDILVRVYFLYAFMCFFGVAIVGKIWHIQHVRGDELRSLADSLTTRNAIIEPARGNIYSADGSLLATSVPTYDLYLDLQLETITTEVFKAGLDSLALGLSKILGDKTPYAYKQLLISARKPGPGKRYFPLKKNVTHAQQKKLYELPIFRLGRYKGGLIAEVKNKRLKPFSILADRTIGYKTDSSAVGIEGAFDTYLKGNTGVRVVQKISGNVWKPINDENEIEPMDGNDVITTIDVNLQDVAESELERQLRGHKADKGCAILMEVQTGAIMAIANLQMVSEGVYRESYNFGVGQSTEPGSTFKLASMMALMEDGYADPDDSVDTQGGVINYYGNQMKDSKQGGYGKITLQEVFEHSSNVGISKMIQRHYSKNPQAYVDRIRSFGLEDDLGLQIPGAGKPFINSTEKERWSRLSLPYMSIGYECLFTPLQILTFYNAVANGGKMVKPLLVKEIRNKGAVVKSFGTEVLREKIATDQTLANARKMLEGVVQKGTATVLKHAQYSIAGKTGTAVQAVESNGYNKENKKYQASFVGYFPADKPRYSCIVVVYAPNNNVYYASQVAAPIFKEIADKVYATSIELHPDLMANSSSAIKLPLVKNGMSYTAGLALKEMGVKNITGDKDVEWISTTTSPSQIQFKSRIVSAESVPDVTGMGLRDALYLLESCGLEIKVTGKGAVLRQSIPPGSKIEKGKEIVIQLG